MKQLVEYIVSNLVNHPEDVIIEEQAGDGEFTLINIQVNPEDIGRVIGKSGKVIKAIRQIVRIAAIQKGLKVRVDLIDQQAQPSQTDEVSETSDELPPEAEVEAPQETEAETPQEETENKEDSSKQVYPEAESLETE